MSTHYAGWAIHPEVKKQLLRMCPATLPQVCCDHVMLQTVVIGAPPPPNAEIIVRGMYHDDAVQALVVQVNGIVTRPADGLLFHITVSHAEGYPLRLVGERLKAFPDLVHMVDPWPVVGCKPFVARLQA